MKWNKIIYGIGTLAVIITITYIMIHAWQDNKTTTPFLVKTEQAELETLFKKHNAPTAYAMFKEKTNMLADPVEQHDAAHVFGEALYAHEGVGGMTVCDSFFGFGCFHSFIASAIAEHGLDIVSKLDRDCAARYGVLGLGCPHGIGHGLLSYLGYNSRELAQALEVCEKLSWHHPYGGCTEGVFMEYNFRTMETEVDRRLRSLTSESTFEPCASIPERFRTACYFSQPDWWWHGLSENAGLLPEMGDLCTKVGTTPWVEACFRGIGYVQAAVQNYDVAQSIHACDETAKNTKKRVWCREGAAWALYANPPHTDSATLICSEGLPDQLSKQCLEEYLFFVQ